MTKFNETWIVEAHGPLEPLEPGLLTVSGQIHMPLGNFPRRMTVIGLTEKRTAIWSPISLREPEMCEIEALGDPSFLIVPGASHRLDIKPWKMRYPNAKVICAPGARAAVSEAVPIDDTGDILNDPSVHLETVPGVGEKEAALAIRRADGTSLVVNDILANVRHPPGFGAQIMARLFGFGVHHPRIPRMVERSLVKDRKALAAGFLRWAEEPDLTRVIVSHGDVITQRSATVLRRVAAGLA